MNVQEYIESVPEDKRDAFNKLRNIIKGRIPKGFEEVVNYGMLGYVVPHSIYKDGYHCNPKDPLPFINISANQNCITFYHMGIYGKKELYEWFMEEYLRIAKHKIDSGKSCIRFKYIDEIPYELVGNLVSKITVEEWINYYETTWKNKKKVKK